MNKNIILSHIERLLTAQREYDRGRADADSSALARALQRAKDQLRDSAQSVHPHPRILVAIDHADHPAVTAAVDLAKCLNSPLALVHVIDPSLTQRIAAARVDDADPWKILRNRAVQLLQQSRTHIPSTIPSEWILREGDPAAEILSVAREWAADMIIIGTRNRRPFAQFILGSTSAAVVRLAPCPVLLIHETPPGIIAKIPAKPEPHRERAPRLFRTARQKHYA